MRNIDFGLWQFIWTLVALASACGAYLSPWCWLPLLFSIAVVILLRKMELCWEVKTLSDLHREERKVNREMEIQAQQMREDGLRMFKELNNAL